MSTPSDPKQSKTPSSSSKSGSSNTSKPRQRPQFESHRVRREPTAAATPWYSNWRILVPIAIVVIVGLGLLAFALGQNANRQATPATAIQPTVPVSVVTAAAPSTAPGGAATPAASSGTPAAGAAAAAAAGAGKKYSAPPPMTIDPSKTYVATIETDKGKIVTEMYPQDAPQTVNNFVSLAKDGFYDGLTFHRVEPGFVIQGGDPAGNGTGGPGYTIPAEIKRPHTEGALAMARLSDQVNPKKDSSGSQFYITMAPQPSLDQGGYTVFGQVTQGMDVVKQVAKGDKIKSVTITTK
ncbi:MAG: peptidylprolyl isomerase [Anaerolineae bacterium]